MVAALSPTPPQLARAVKIGRPSSTSSQSLTNCHYVSVVVTNEQTADNGENVITCHGNGLKHTAHDNVIPPPNISNISDEVDNSIELTHNYSNDIDNPSKPKNLSGNHDEVDIHKDIIKQDKHSRQQICK